ncbi:DEDD exonuclease domain-containing protein [Sanguibacter sp. 4.1]|uniref:DEDD exonuclease domain-containing protein n=1 Tax=Sanguibacter biliveldensis TaxID=3030830 RepID=A0AAF0ZBT6_9MICO|nr:DEDD exonuclease domain-containing protein [Sanguibacter sp. 4.1]WPF83803.1 DEDD exonuclease domain-containing protein [Sanguibacter sp. 4.1]
MHAQRSNDLRPAPGPRDAGKRLPGALRTVSGTLRSPGPVDMSGTPVQLGLDELGTPLSDVTFVVVDLETTGGSSKDSGITEIGAVKVRGGEVIGEFQSLVNPGVPVPAFIARLTGITTLMVASAPGIELVLPSFLEFARGAVLVAHNAPFDISFLKAAARRMDLAWPGNQVLDTVPLARRVVTRDEAPNHKLGTLAALFRATVTPDHRALSDARATVDVMHALFDRMAPLGITHLEDLATATDPVPDDIRKRRHLADDMPSGPGVYMFVGPADEVLYVGTSKNVRTRVRSYFTAAEKRSRMTEMIRLAVSVRAVPCATDLEARVRELRLITEHAPRYNRRSKHPERMHWVRLSAEAYPRLTVVRDGAAGPGEAVVGPFVSRSRATEAVEALQSAHQVRQCTKKLPAVPSASASACVLAEMGRCSAPCVRPEARPATAPADDYADVVAGLARSMAHDPSPVVTALARRIAEHVEQQRFEDAGTDRDRLEAFLAGASRAQRLAPVVASPQIVAARPTETAGWEIVVVRYGRLATTAVCKHGQDPLAAVASAVAVAEHVVPPTSAGPACHPEETDLVVAWLRSPGVRLVETDLPLTCPVSGAEKYVVGRSTAEVVSAAG